MKKRLIMTMTLLLVIVYQITDITEVYAADITDPTALGDYTHYNGIIFDYFESYGADIEGALAVGGESQIGTSGQFDVGAAAAPDYSQVAIGSYDNPNGYPSMLLNGLTEVGNNTKNNIQVFGGPLVMNENLQSEYQNQTNQITGTTKFAASQIVDDFFSGAYDTVTATVDVLANAQQSPNAEITVADFTGWEAPSQFKNNLTDFIPDNLNTHESTTGISADNVLVINITDSGHVSVNSPQITSAFGDYDLIIFNFPNATSVDFTGGSLAVDGVQINTSAPEYWLPEENAVLAKYAEKVIWNFPEAESVQIYASGVVGSVLAPDALVEGHGGSINGMLMADSFIMENGHELHAFRMNGGIFDFTNNNILGSVILYKVDADDNGLYLEGAEFRLEVWNDSAGSWESYSTETDSLTTDISGRITVEDLPEGRYRFVELSPPTGYDLPTGNDLYHEFTIDADNGVDAAVEITVENTKTPEPAIDIDIKKIDQATSDVLEGARFALYRLEDGDITLISSDITTDVNGKATLTGLKEGTYYLMEFIPPDGYDLVVEYFVIRIEITSDGSGGLNAPRFFLTDGTEVFLNSDDNLEILNAELTSPRVSLIKVDAENGTMLSGAVFDLFVWDPSLGSSGDWTLHTGGITTNAQGYFVMYGLADGDYKLVEVSPPDGYTISGDGTFPFSVQGTTNDKVIQITAENDAIKGGIEIEKSDSGTGAALADAEFTLYRIETDNAAVEVATLVTDADGKASIDNLPQGTYWLQETKAPKGYELPDSSAWNPIIIGDDGTGNFVYSHTIAIENEPITGSVTLTKVDGDDPAITLAGVVFSLYKFDENIQDWRLHTASVTTDANGVLQITNLSLGTYKFVEINNPNTGYEGHEAEIIFSITSSGTQDITLTMRNYKEQFPELDILKVDENNNVLPGAQFVLLRSDTNDFETDGAYTVYGTAASDTNGRIVFPQLVAGYYRLLEIKAPDGYVNEHRFVDLEVRDVSGTLKVFINDIDITEIVNSETLYIENRQYEPADVTFVKVDANDSSIGLSGAKFDLYFSESGESGTFSRINTVVSDENGLIQLQGLVKGQYRLVEAAAPDGYEILEGSIAFEVRSVDNKLIVYFDGAAVDDTANIEIENTKKTIDVSLLKVDADDSSVTLAGAEFNVYFSETGEDGTYSSYGTVISGENGRISLEELETGFYRLLETQAPEGYDGTGTIIEFEIRLENDELVVYLIADGNESQADADGGILIENKRTEESEEPEEPEEPEDTEDPEEPQEPQDPEEEDETETDVVFTKVDKDDPSIVLSGAKFNVYYSESGAEGSYSSLGTVVSDKNGEIQLQSLKEGFYRFVEAEAPEGYAGAGTVIDFEIRLENGKWVLYYQDFTFSLKEGILITNTKVKNDDSENETTENETADGRIISAESVPTGDAQNNAAVYVLFIGMSALAAAFALKFRKVGEN